MVDHCVECLHRSKGKKRVEALSGRLWCQACAPESRETIAVAPDFRHGYYVAATEQEFGDAEFAQLARKLWEARADRPSDVGDCKSAFPPGSARPPVTWDPAAGCYRCAACGTPIDQPRRAAQPPSRSDVVSVYTLPDGTIARRMTQVGPER